MAGAPPSTWIAAPASSSALLAIVSSSPARSLTNCQPFCSSSPASSAGSVCRRLHTGRFAQHYVSWVHRLQV